MKLTRKHIGGLFDVRGGDGSYVMRLVDVKRGLLLFYSYGGHYIVEAASRHDYRRYNKKQWDDRWTARAWENPTYGKELL